MAPPSPCHYDVLGVPRSADVNEIRKAYKQKALQFHPDKNPNGDQQFKLISKAYSVLSNESEKRKYDNERIFRPTPAPKQPTYSQPTSHFSAAERTPSPRRTDPNFTKEFINKIIQQDREVAGRKQNMSFQSWYRNQQKEVHQQFKASEELKKQQQARESMEEQMQWERNQRMKDIASELERAKQETELRREAERKMEEARAQEFEKKRQKALDEIAQEEKKYQDMMKNLANKWEQSNAPNALNRLGSGRVSKEMKKQTPIPSTKPNDILNDDKLEETLKEVRQQREQLKRDISARRREEKEIWDEVRRMKVDLDNEDYEPVKRTSETKQNKIFNWSTREEPPKSSRTLKEELKWLRNELEAEDGKDDRDRKEEALASPMFSFHIEEGGELNYEESNLDISLNDAFVR